MSARQCQGLMGYFLRITREGENNGIDIPLPANRMKRTSDCFVQWRDKQKGGAWGLNFVSEKDARKFYQMCVNVPEFHGRPESVCSSMTSASTILQSPPPPVVGNTDYPKNTRRASRNRNSSCAPVIQVSDPSDLYDSGIGHEVGNSLPLPKGQSRHSHAGSDSGSSHGNHIDMNGINQQTNGASDNSIPNDMDPLEYEFLQQQINGIEDNNLLMDSLAINSNSLSGSRSSLYVPADFDDSSDRVSEDFGELRPASAIVHNKQFGTTRKAGWLVIKNVLIHSKKGKLEQAHNRKWKKYWTALKGIELLFYHCDEKTVTQQDLDEPSHRLDIDRCIVQAVPEHAKLENVFSLSSKHGNAYYLQTTSQVEVENWIHCIHTAAASAFARQRGSSDVIAILVNEINNIESKIADDEKLRKMAELQSKVVTDARNKQTIVDQVSEWERSLENLNVDIFRYRCYLAAVQDISVPNPQSLLSSVSRSVKHTLSKIGVFSVASFHAFVSVRESLSEPPVKPEKTRRRLRGGNSLKSKLLQSLKIVDDKVVEGIRNKHSPRGKRRGSAHSASDSGDNDSSRSQMKERRDTWGRIGNFLQVQLPNNQTTMVPFERGMTVNDIVQKSCEKRHLPPADHFLMLLSEDNDSGLMDYVIPQYSELLEEQKYTTLKICLKTSLDVELDGPADYDSGPFGIGLSQNEDGRILVSRVDEGSPAKRAMILEEDEIIMINGENIRDTGIAVDYVSGILDSSKSVSLQLLSSRIDDQKKTRQTTENLISFLVCPPPPKTSQYEINDDTLDTLIVPPPMDDDEDAKSSVTSRSGVGNSTPARNDDIDALLSRTEEVNIIFRQMNEFSPDDPRIPTNIKPGQRLRKIVVELQETERTYVKNLCLLLERYLLPLKEESFLSRDEVDSLVSNVSEIYDFQTNFLENLEDIVRTDKDFFKYEEVSDFQNVLYGIAETFLEYVDKFKLYSTFCSCHSRAVKLLEPGTNPELQAFLEARNPKQQHSGTLESYLITPIQRILRYPLLIKEMLKLMDNESEEYRCLTEALISVEKVANYINEMQMISETYSPRFEKLCENVDGVEPTGMGVDNLLHYGKVRWLQGPDKEGGSATIRNNFIIGKGKKENENDATLFVFKKAVVLVVYDHKVRKKTNSPSSSLKVKATDEVKFQTLIPIWSVLIRDYAWSSNDTNHIWEIVDTDSQGTGQETPYMFVNKSAEDKRQFVMAIKEATKLSSQPNISPRGPPVVPPKPRIIKDQNQNSNILPSRPNLLAGKMRRFESKCSEASKSSWARNRPRVNSDSDSSNNSAGIDSGVSFDGGSSPRKNGARKKISNVF
ncbi:protein still life, isoforms C/SIF type 2-like isoform X1 [Rhopilema esculentum]|uniref:protein still life, isoforms C/SIF type 2-like isoform X1 n=1 Tax=Rhopilema esculentum TaxID=499914 RepID=UPI0031DE4D56